MKPHSRKQNQESGEVELAEVALLAALLIAIAMLVWQVLSELTGR